MKFKTLDDYYNWTCDWCDSENRTLWVRVAAGEITCGACHRATPDPSSTINPRIQPHPLVAGLC